MTEIELKLLLPDAEAARRVLGSAALKARAEGPARRRRLRSIYFDAADGSLRAAGIAFRVRQVGRAWVQTVKRGPSESAGGGLYSVAESECAAPGGRPDPARIPDEALRDAVAAALNGSPLVPVFETDIQRTTRNLAAPGGLVELALDLGEVIAGNRRAALAEAELELKDGAPAALYDLAREVFAEGGWRFSERTKAARGRALSEGAPAVPAPAPRRALDVPLARGETAETAAVRILRECLGQIDANMAAVLAAEAPEGPHQLRIGLRRLRTAFGLFREALGGPALAELNARARDLGARVGALRDLDVQIGETLARRLADPEAPDRAGLEALKAALEDRRRAARAEVRAALAGPEGRLFLLDLSAFAELRGWLAPADHAQTGALARPVEEVAAEALDRRWRKVRKAARGLAEADDHARHALRKELKKLRYGVEFLGPLFPRRRVKGFVKRLKSLQEDFGALNDAAVAEAMFAGPGAPCAADPAAQRAAGRLLGALAERARADRAAAEGDWARLKAEPPFWR